MGTDEQTARSIWRALGSYIAKQLINGKGVQIPKFGNFTYSATELDMAVSYFIIDCLFESTSLTFLIIIGNY